MLLVPYYSNCVLQYLIASQEMNMLKEDTEKKLKIISLQYETKLQDESDALYASMNDKIKNLENCHKEVCTCCFY